MKKISERRNRLIVLYVLVALSAVAYGKFSKERAIQMVAEAVSVEK